MASSTDLDRGKSDARTDPRFDRSRKAALEAARQLLLTEGWDAVTHLRVAQQSGLARPTIYRHWPDRVAILNDLLAMETTQARFMPTGDLRRDLIRGVKAIRDELVDRDFARVLAALIDRGEWDPDIQRIRITQAYDTVASIREILRSAISDGELRRDLDPELAIAQLVGPVVYLRLVSSNDVPRRAVERLVDQFLDGCRARPKR